MKTITQLLLLMLCLLAIPARSADTTTVSNAWARATAPGQEVGAAYMSLKSTTNAELVKVETPAAGSVEIHMMSMKNGVMEMRMLDKLALPAGKSVDLAPGGFHLMLFDLKKPLKSGENVPFTLSIKYGNGKVISLQTTVPIKAGKN